jgi:hypothetical protein
VDDPDQSGECVSRAGEEGRIGFARFKYFAGFSELRTLLHRNKLAVQHAASFP